MPPFLAIFVCTTVAARWRMTSRSECSVETDSSAMIGMAVARLRAASPAMSQMATGCGDIDVVRLQLLQKAQRRVVRESRIRIHPEHDVVAELSSTLPESGARSTSAHARC